MNYIQAIILAIVFVAWFCVLPLILASGWRKKARRIAAALEPGYVLKCDCGGSVELRKVINLQDIGEWTFGLYLIRHGENKVVAEFEQALMDVAAANLDTLTPHTAQALLSRLTSTLN